MKRAACVGGAKEGMGLGGKILIGKVENVGAWNIGRA